MPLREMHGKDGHVEKCSCEMERIVFIMSAFVGPVVRVSVLRDLDRLPA